MSTDTRVNDVTAVEQAKISLTQAISTAESHVKGTAYKAKFKQSRLGAIYDVDVVQGNQVFDVKIDAVKGDVLSSVVDNAEHDSDD
ncbi:hypothetical protein B4916_16245 [Yersinia intermedia]|nr:hypothetical protein B4916_16245 [Yersinia intermedia]